jgi:preprotein translocase subunit SecD
MANCSRKLGRERKIAIAFCRSYFSIKFKDNSISKFTVRTQLSHLIILPLIAIVSASCNLDGSSLDRQGGVQLTIQLKPTKQHPQISETDRTHVQRVIEGRVNGLGVKDADIKSIDNNRILVQLPGVKDARQAERILGGTAQLEFRAQKAGTEGRLGAELAVLKDEKDRQAMLKKSQAPDKQAILATQSAIEQQYTEIGKLFSKAALSGGNLRDAAPQPVGAGSWEIAIEFDDVGSKAFANLTKNLAGTGRSIGVFIDNDPISTPTVGAMFAETGITGGKAVITGNFTTETANDLAIQLRSGSLPVPVELIENRIIKPK